MSRINYHHLFYFRAVALAGNLTQVAQKLHVSQSALSSQIKQLESNINVQLFDRVGRRLILTEEGKKILAYANDIFSKGEELESLLENGMIADKQHLSIGVLTTLSRNFIESFIKPLLDNPNVSFSLASDNMSNLLNRLANHELDLVLTNRSVSQDNRSSLWRSHLVSRQPLAIIGPKGHRITTDFPEGYENVNWVLPGKDTETRTAFDALCGTWQYTPNIQAEADDMAMLRLLARDSGALAVLPTVVVKDEIEHGILEEYQHLSKAFEHFYAITAERKFFPNVLLELLQQHMPLRS